MSDIEKIRIGIRNSQLSIVQTNQFIEHLFSFYPRFNKKNIIIKYIKTSGDIHQRHRLDQIGGKGLFTREIEEKIIGNELDIGVHSMKDMPSQLSDGLEIACYTPRYDVQDVLVANNHAESSFENLSPGLVIGTSSIRRRSQILHMRKDLFIKSMRGNIDTRIKKLKKREFDAVILSYAGIKRLGLENKISQIIPINLFLPAACQGAVGIQINSNNEELKNFLKPLIHHDTKYRCEAERKVLEMIGVNCNSPISVLSEITKDEMTIQCHLFDHNGKKIFNSLITGSIKKHLELAEKIGLQLINSVGHKTIKKLDSLENDFDYSPTN